jgi:2-polyprenyl-3-methyl-5-hydroxy-6-metoxy-1,4-benzoquinol methylase
MDKFGEYQYRSTSADHLANYLWNPVLAELGAVPQAKRIFDLGCGNGAFANALAGRGYEVVAVDASVSGIAHAKATNSLVQFEVASAYDDLASRFGTFDCVVSLEVVEHLYSPQLFAKCIFDLLTPGGIALVSTPYHGYLKNLSLAVTGKMDAHFTALWEHGHIKFWSVKTLTQLLTDKGLVVDKFLFAGRFRYLAKSMIAVAHKPKSV